MSLWDIANSLEDVGVGLHQLLNLLQIYDECIEDELEFVAKHTSDGTVRYLIDR